MFVVVCFTHSDIHVPTQENQSSNNTVYFQFIFCEITCFCCNVVEALARLWCYAACVGSCLLTFGTDYWSHLKIPLRMGPVGHHETSVIATNIHYMKSQKIECPSFFCVWSVSICAVIFQSPWYPQFFITEEFLIYLTLCEIRFRKQ